MCLRVFVVENSVISVPSVVKSFWPSGGSWAWKRGTLLTRFGTSSRKVDEVKASLDQVIERLKAAQRALVIGHLRPDGDAIGSVAALTLILRKLGVEAEGCIPDPVPWFYREIAGTRVLKGVEELRGREFDTFIVLDSSDVSRIGPAADLLGGK